MRTVAGTLSGVLWLFVAAGSTRADDIRADAKAREGWKWEFHGAVTFPADAVEHELANDLDVAYALRNEQPDDSTRMLELLSHKVTAGYLRQGFPDVKASATINHSTKKITITIDEGPRFTAGEVRVTGAKAIDAAQLVRELIPAVELKPGRAARAGDRRSDETKQPICWQVGRPARLDQGYLEELRRRVETLLSDQGRVLAHFTIETKPQVTQGQAPLLIDFSDEGVPVTIGDVDILGNMRTSREELLEFLELQPGTVLTKVVSERVNDRLKNSGRFLKSSVKTIPPKNQGETLKLRIDITECDLAPPLGEVLSREDQTLVRFSRWARDFEHGDDELIFKITGAWGAGELIVSPAHGILALARGVGAGDNPAEAAAPFDFAYLATDDQIGLFSLRRRRKVVAVPPPSPLIATLACDFHSYKSPMKGKGEIRYGLCMTSQAKKGTRRHFQIHINQVAAAALALAHLEHTRSTWESDVLRLEYGDHCLRIDEQTGRLVELLLLEAHCRVSISQGEFSKRVEVIEAAAVDFANDADDARPLSCVCDFICDEVLAWPVLTDDPQIRRGVEMGRKVCGLRALEPIDELLAAACRPSPDDHKFFIPQDNPPAEETATDLRGTVRIFARYFGLAVGDHLYPKETWIWNLWRTIVFRFAEMPAPADTETPRMLAPADTGALGRLVAGQLLGRRSEGTSAAIADDGLRRLSLDDFRRDYAAFLDHESLVGRYVWRLAEVVRGLDQDDLDWLEQTVAQGKLVRAETAETLFELARLLRASDQPVEAALPGVLDTWWRLGLRAAVESKLNAILAGTYATRGHAWIGRGDWRQAIREFDQSIERDPTNAAYLTARGHAWNRRGQWDKAIADSSEAIRLDPNCALAYNNRGFARFERGEHEMALEDFNEATKHDPKLAYPYYNRGRYYNLRGEYARAVEELTKAIELAPKADDYYLERASAYYHLREYELNADDRRMAARLVNRSKEVKSSAASDQAKEVKIDATSAPPTPPLTVSESAGRQPSPVPTDSTNSQPRAAATSNDASSKAASPSPARQAHKNAVRLLHSDDERYRDAERALESATEACKLTDWKSALYLHTLAEAYAELGEFEKAIEWQTKAIDLSPRDRQLQSEAKANLQRYRAGKSWRDPLKKAENANAGG